MIKKITVSLGEYSKTVVKNIYSHFKKNGFSASYKDLPCDCFSDDCLGECNYEITIGWG